MSDMKMTVWNTPGTGKRYYLDPEEVWDKMPRTDPYDFKYKIADMERILSAKYWVESDGSLVITGLVERGRVRAQDVAKVLADELGEWIEEMWTGR